MFLGNSAVGFGGAILNWKGSGAAQINRCSFVGNFAEGGGGAIHTREAAGAHTIVNCLFAQNGSPAGAALQFVDQAEEVVVVNCTIGANNAAVGGLHATGWGTTVELSNCVAWDNAGEQLVQDNGAQLWVTWSDIEGGWAGEGNIDADPLFGSACDSNYGLSPGSPCIDAGDNTAVPPDITTDLCGDPRFVDDACTTPDTGNGDPPIVDMGAYEYQPCAGDLDCDGKTDQADLGILLADWGCVGSGPEDCPADLDGDFDTDHSDLGILLADWGCDINP